MEPIISVIIPAYNEEKLLQRCLESLQKQTYPKDKFEIIVVDNNSKDNTALIGEQFGARVFTYKDVQGCAASRQYGATKAKGTILAFTDSDTMPEVEWLEKIDRLFKDPELVCVGGRAVPDQDKLSFKLIYSVYYGFDHFHNFIHKPLLGGYNLAIKKEAYEKVGGFNPTIFSQDDWELSIRLYKAFGAKAVKYVYDLKVAVSVRKQKSIPVLMRYQSDMLSNYVNLVVLGKTKSKSLVNVR